MLDEVALEELRRRHVDRDTCARPALHAPGGRGGGRGVQDPVGQLVYEPGLFGDLDELLRGGDAAVGLAPAQQGLGTRGLEALERHLRLVHEQQLPPVDRATQRLLQAKALRGSIVEGWTVEREAVAAELLGAKQCHVRGAQQPFRVRGVIGIQARADAGAGGEHATVDDERLLQCRHQPRGVRFDLLAGLHVLQQHRELIPAQAREQCIGARGGVQPLGDVLQHAIAEAVAERVVDRLEVVHIHEQQREALPGSCARECLLEVRCELAAVGKLRQRIMMRQVMQLPRALADALLELHLLSAQLPFSEGDAVGHGVEGFGKLVDLG